MRTQLDALGLEQRRVLLGERVLGLFENADEIRHGERFQLHANRKAPLQLRNHVARLRDMERTGGDEQNVIGAHETVARVDRGAFDDRQNVALHAFAADVGAVAGFAAGDFVDLVQENNAAGFHALERHARDLLHIDELLLFFLHQVIERFGDAHACACGCAGRKDWAACP